MQTDLDKRLDEVLSVERAKEQEKINKLILVLEKTLAELKELV